MKKTSAWISALRPRTLFLAIATTICGSSVAYTTGSFNITIAILTILIATLLQLLSNLANDLGDFEHGTDTTGKRVGPQRSLQSGNISLSEMKSAIKLTIALCAIVGVLLIYEALQFMHYAYIILFFILGLLSIWAAVKYTSGKNPYGYKGLGDIFSFIFFGLVSVVGTYFLHVHSMSLQPWLPAIGMGFFTAAVLNINNMRDIKNDKEAGKITIPVRIGIKNAKIYHTALTFGGIFSFILYSLIYGEKAQEYIYLIVMVGFIKILIDIIKIKDDYKLDPYLKYTSIITFILSLAFGVCLAL